MSTVKTTEKTIEQITEDRLKNLQSDDVAESIKYKGSKKEAIDAINGKIEGQMQKNGGQFLSALLEQLVKAKNNRSMRPKKRAEEAFQIEYLTQLAIRETERLQLSKSVRSVRPEDKESGEAAISDLMKEERLKKITLKNNDIVSPLVEVAKKTKNSKIIENIIILSGRYESEGKQQSQSLQNANKALLVKFSAQTQDASKIKSHEGATKTTADPSDPLTALRARAARLERALRETPAKANANAKLKAEPQQPKSTPTRTPRRPPS